MEDLQVPFDRSRYPANWEDFSRRIRFDRAGGQCECAGECGLHDGRDLFFPVAKRCDERHGALAKWADPTSTIILTVAHLNGRSGPCACDPLCADEAHVKAMCQRCHLSHEISAAEASWREAMRTSSVSRRMWAKERAYSLAVARADRIRMCGNAVYPLTGAYAFARLSRALAREIVDV